MPQMISRFDLARLHHDLQLPHLLAAVLDSEICLTKDATRILREKMRSLTPMETLISLACCFQIIEPHLDHDIGLTEPLLTQADYILDDYAPYWMKHAGSLSVEWQEFIRDDLAGMAEFLQLMADASHGHHPAVSDICLVLGEEALLKSDIEIEAGSDNVIRFPVERRITAISSHR